MLYTKQWWLQGQLEFVFFSSRFSALLFWLFFFLVPVEQGDFNHSFSYPCPGLQEVTACCHFPASSPPETLRLWMQDQSWLDFYRYVYWGKLYLVLHSGSASQFWEYLLLISLLLIISSDIKTVKPGSIWLWKVYSKLYHQFKSSISHKN